jgi:hypothetical protein
MTDNVPDDQFEAAIVEAKAEQNLSRANVVRKVKDEPAKSKSERPEHLRKTRRHDANRIVEQTVIALEGLCLGVELIDYAEIDPLRIPAWQESLRASLRVLNRLGREIAR